MGICSYMRYATRRPARVRKLTMDGARNRGKEQKGCAGKHIRIDRIIECANPSMYYREIL